MFTGSRVYPPDGASTWPSHDRGFSFAAIPISAAQVRKTPGQVGALNFRCFSGRWKIWVASRLRIRFVATGQGLDE